MLDIRASHGDLSFKGPVNPVCMSELMETILRAFTENEKSIWFRVVLSEAEQIQIILVEENHVTSSAKFVFKYCTIRNKHPFNFVSVFFSFDCHCCFGNIATDVQAYNAL